MPRCQREAAGEGNLYSRPQLFANVAIAALEREPLEREPIDRVRARLEATR